MLCNQCGIDYRIAEFVFPIPKCLLISTAKSHIMPFYVSNLTIFSTQDSSCYNVKVTEVMAVHDRIGFNQNELDKLLGSIKSEYILPN
jgi:hypothetical protein